MTLPVRPLPTSEVDGIAFRSLTMREASAFAKLTDNDAQVAYVIACGCDATEAEVATFLDGTSFGTVQTLVSAILTLSGLRDPDAKEGEEPADPKSPTSEPS